MSRAEKLCVDSTPQYNARKGKTGSAAEDQRLPFAQPAPIRGVHLQQADRRSAYRGAPDNQDSVALEVLIPSILPRMKQPDERAAFRIKSTQFRSLARIAVVAGESDVFAVASSDMLGFAPISEIRKYGGPYLTT